MASFSLFYCSGLSSALVISDLVLSLSSERKLNDFSSPCCSVDSIILIFREVWSPAAGTDSFLISAEASEALSLHLADYTGSTTGVSREPVYSLRKGRFKIGLLSLKNLRLSFFSSRLSYSISLFNLEPFSCSISRSTLAKRISISSNFSLNSDKTSVFTKLAMMLSDSLSGTARTSFIDNLSIK